MASIFNPRSWFGDADKDAAAAQAPPEPAWQRQHLPGPSKGIVARIREKLNGYVGQQQSAGTPQERFITDEKAATGPRNVVFPWFLPYFDNHTRETEAMRLAYRHMLADPVVKSALFSKLFGVCSLDLKILPADKKNPKDKAVAQHVQWMLTERLRDGVPGLIWSVLLGALVDGYSISEKVWTLEERGRYAGNYSLSQVKPKDVGQDVVLQTDEFYNIVGLQGLRYNAGLELSPADFLIYRHLPLYNSPAGFSDLRSAYSSYWALDTCRKLRAIHAEKTAIPMLVGHYLNTTVKGSLEAALMKAKSQRWLSAPEGARIGVMDMAGSGEAIFKSWRDDCIHEIYLSIQYAVLQSLEGETTDGRGNSQVHQSTAEKCVRFLANSMESLLNDRDTGLIKDMVDLNHVVGEYPRAQLSAVDVNELVQEMTIDAGLRQLGWVHSIEELSERYGRNVPEDEEDKLKPPPGPAGGGALSPGGKDDPLPFDDVNILTAQPKSFPPARGAGGAKDFRGQRFNDAWRKYLAAD
jgi:uncharacterized protein DUF935